MRLRDYQIEAVERIQEAFQSNRSTLVVMPTGTGKTIVFADLIQRMNGSGRAMVMAHRDELIRQAVSKITQHTGHEPDVEMAEYWADQNLMGLAPVVVSSVQTLNSGMDGKGRMIRFHPERFGLLTIDEAHHSTAKTYRKVVEHFQQNPDLKVFGCTATPDRCDEEALGQIFDTVAYEYEILDAINDGWLVPIQQQFVMVEDLDFSRCRSVAGDFNQGDLDALLREEKNLHGIVGPTLDIVGDRKTLVFTVTVQQADRTCEIINRHKPGSAAFVHGKTPKDERRQILAAYRSGSYQFLVNVGIATEGFDEPSIQVIVGARPTKSRSLYAQMIGRGTRPLEEIVPFINDCDEAASRRTIIAGSPKPSMLVIDFVGNSGQHKLVYAADVLGGTESDAVVHRARSKPKDSGAPSDVVADLAAAREEIEEELKHKRRSVVGSAKWRARTIDPFDVFDLTPKRERAWHRGRKPTEKQLAFLNKSGVDGVAQLSFTEAGTLIGTIIKGRKDGAATYKQRRILLKYGCDPDCTFDEASAKIDAIAKNGWRAA